MASEWRTAADKVRKALANPEGSSPLVSTDRLKTLGYIQPGMDQAELDERNAARDAKFIRPVEQAS